jgi:predicted MFS family arabinose efflux permease
LVPAPNRFGNDGGHGGWHAGHDIVTVWNLAIAGGGLIGGVLLGTTVAVSFPWAMIAALVRTLIVACAAKRRGFPTAASDVA